MREQFPSRVFFTLVRPRVILAALTLFYFVLIPKAYTSLGLCLYNWSDVWYASFLLVIAALALSLRSWWGYLISISLSAHVAYTPLVVILKIFRVLPVTAAEAVWATPNFVLTYERRWEEFYIAPALAALIFLHGLSSLASRDFRKPPALP